MSLSTLIGFDFGHGDKSVAAIQRGGTVRIVHSPLRQVIEQFSPATVLSENFETYDAVEHNACIDLAAKLGSELRIVNPRITALRHKDWQTPKTTDERDATLILRILVEGITHTTSPKRMDELPEDSPEARVMALRRDPNRNAEKTITTYLPPVKDCPYPELLTKSGYSTRVEFFILAALETNSRKAFEALIQCHGAGKKNQWRSEFYYGIVGYYLNVKDGFHPRTGLVKHFVERERRKEVMKRVTKAVRWIRYQTVTRQAELLQKPAVKDTQQPPVKDVNTLTMDA